ncbi:MAG TPA: SDR family NAD(P)-dependent oxidoreductase, partial [Pseudonocardia sp.]
MSQPPLGATVTGGALATGGAIVTGGATGIGRGIALACARAGADVAVHYRGDDDARDRAAAIAVAQEVTALGRRG